MRTEEFRTCKKEAAAFLGVAEWIDKRGNLGTFLDGDMYPYFVNAAFSCELYIKAIMIYNSPNGDFEIGHDLAELFRKLPLSDKAKIEKEYTQRVCSLQNSWKFNKMLDEIKDNFINWRYAFERDMASHIQEPLIFAEVLKDYVGDLS